MKWIAIALFGVGLAACPLEPEEKEPDQVLELVLCPVEAADDECPQEEAR